MILKKINIEQYQWRVTLLMDTDCSNNKEIIKELDKTKFIPVKFIDGSDAIGIDYNGNN